MQEAVAFVKAKAETATRAMTKTHREIVNSFLEYKAQQEAICDERESLR